MLTNRQIEVAIKATKPGTERVLSDGSEGKNMGSLKLHIRAGAEGVTAAWYATWKQHGKRGKRQLGRYPIVTLAAAREAMRGEIQPVLQAGKNPKAAALATNKPTVEKLFSAFIQNMRASGKTSDAIYEYALLTGKHNAASALGRTRLAADIGPDDIAHLLAGIAGRGSRSSADHMRRYLSAAFNWGIKSAHNYLVAERQDWGIKHNPVAQVQRDGKANGTRERALTAEEIKTLWRGMAGVGYATETTCCVRLLLACGQRTRETLRVAGCDVDLENAVWTMPAEKTKGGMRQHVVPLPAQAVEVFKILKDFHGDGPLFPSRAGSGPYATDGSISRALRRFIKANKMEHFQLRDLRRTWKTRTAEAGIDRFMRDLLQQHAMGDTGSKHYDRAEYLAEKRAAMAAWETWLNKTLA